MNNKKDLNNSKLLANNSKLLASPNDNQNHNRNYSKLPDEIVILSKKIDQLKQKPHSPSTKRKLVSTATEVLNKYLAILEQEKAVNETIKPALQKLADLKKQRKSLHPIIETLVRLNAIPKKFSVSITTVEVPAYVYKRFSVKKVKP